MGENMEVKEARITPQRWRKRHGGREIMNRAYNHCSARRESHRKAHQGPQ